MDVSKKRHIPSFKVPKRIILKEGYLHGISDNLSRLIRGAENVSPICFEDIRSHPTNPNLANHVIVTEKKNDKTTINLNPALVYEDDIAHEIIEMELVNRYPKLAPITGGKNPIFSYISNFLFSGLVDFEVERRLNELSFSGKESYERDKNSLFSEWAKREPYSDLPFDRRDANWELTRQLRAGIILAQFSGRLTKEEEDYINKRADEMMPEARIIADLFRSYGEYGWKDEEEFASVITKVINALNLGAFITVSPCPRKQPIE
jgi:hypothetical protein